MCLNRNKLCSFCICLIAISTLCGALAAEDWPTWRKDSSRTASATETLPSNLHLQWSRHYLPPRAAWPEDPRLMFDASYEPVVAGQTMYIASAQTNSVTAIATDSGEHKWRFFAEGPIRFSPIVDSERMYFGSDDGNLYCLDSNNGSLKWKLNAAPNARKVIGNDRLISVWPIRGGPVLHGNKIFFAAGVWPFEGTFLYKVDLTSQLVPPSFDVITLPPDMLPQGYLAATDDSILIPCGRGKVRRFDVKTERIVKINYDSRALTDYHVAASGKWMFHGNKVVDLVANRELPVQVQKPAINGSVLYSSIGEKVVGGIDLTKPVVSEAKDKQGKTVKRTRYDAWGVVPDLGPKKGEVPVPVSITLRSGDRLYGFKGSTVFAMDLPTEATPIPKVTWSREIKGQPSSMLSADDKLFVTTREGDIHCFAGKATTVRDYPRNPDALATNDQSSVAANIFEVTNATSGFCVVLGLDQGKLVDELVRQSKLRIVVLDQDPARIDSLRNRMTEAGLYGGRVDAYVGDILTASLPPYLANLIVSEDWSRVGLDRGKVVVDKIYSALRPYGGVACIDLAESEKQGLSALTAELSRAELKSTPKFTTLTRVGKLEGAGDWTDEYGNAANTLMSTDKLVKPPLGVLWFGGPASHPDLFYDRHQWASSAIIVHGRMFIQGPQKLTAVDVYTGRILWQIPLKQGLSPGCRAAWESTGFHFLASADRIYLTYEKVCMVMDAANGEKIKEIKLPDDKLSFGRIRIWNDSLIVPAFSKHEKYGPVPSKLFALDRFDGSVTWQIESELSFPFIAIGNDRIYAFEGLLGKLYKNQERKGVVPESDPKKFLTAFDIRSGKPVWQRPTTRVVTWLAFSQKNDVLIGSDITGVEAWQGSDGNSLWSKDSTGVGFRGHPENLWDKVILWNDRIIDQRGPGKSYDLVTGKPIVNFHPITGKPYDWAFTKVGHHCNYAIASEHLMTFRADSAGFLDLQTKGTSHLQGFRSGCRNSLIPANGVLNAPNFANGCICSYSLFTSLAFVHDANAEKWSYSAIPIDDGPVKKIGVNLGAPGDRQDETGTLWLDHPSAGGLSPEIEIKVAGKGLRWFRQHASKVQGEEYSWVASSGVEGLDKISIRLSKETDAKQPYQVSLFFVDPGLETSGERVFDVLVQGKEVISGLDIAKETGGNWRSLKKEFTADLNGILEIYFKAVSGRTVLSGVKVTLIEEKSQQ